MKRQTRKIDALDHLEDQLPKHGIQIDCYPVRKEGYLQFCDGVAPYIAFNPSLSSLQQAAVAYQEAGHPQQGLGASTGKNERRADKWAEVQLIHVERIAESIMCVSASVYDLA